MEIPCSSPSTSMRLTGLFFYQNVSTTIGSIAVEFGSNVNGPQIMNYNQVDPLKFHLVPSSGQMFSLSVHLFYVQIAAKYRISYESPTGYLA